MPSFAMLGEIHGNLPALQAVLSEIALFSPDEIVVAGDLINRGPQSLEILEELQSRGWPIISGNHETWLLSLAKGSGLPENWDCAWWAPVRRIVAQLTPTWQDWIAALPFSFRVSIPGTSPVLIVHGSPRHNREGMGKRLPLAQLDEVIIGIEEETMIGAHIHYPYERWHARKHLITVGAVGNPHNGDTNAQYGLFRWQENEEGQAYWHFYHRSVPYNRHSLVAAWQENGHLSDGNIAAHLLLLEHLTAASYYAPFWDWCVARRLPMTSESYDLFGYDISAPALPIGIVE